ncbi:DUF1028 domain-containing protein [Nocardioides nitrophenolicus]|uniref:DUF1028 domain-containing protein n=1 Tax=Nocardioides nitrophenolicus TaxID=60489 RepID=UPI00195ABC34|nr:DUF1028 domain-containing protein [Nocardioides nitrophenolicus]MBM7520018.1 putative Ntn-hydrolase superfamily protein [Nocardioides nitrophenolicus]
MTFSVLGTDGKGAVGIAVTSSSPAVAARCIHLRPGVGGASSQNITDPRLGTALLDALQSGLDARAALASVTEGREHIEHRQLTVLTLDGRGAAYSGAGSLGVHHQVVGDQVVAAGNLLATTEVVDAVAAGFAAASGELEERLLAALEAGLAAGGEAGPVRSAGLSVVRDVDWRETDLRVDWSDDPIGQLRELLGVWLPQRDDYVTRGIDPTTAPSYGVPGDE